MNCLIHCSNIFCVYFSCKSLWIYHLYGICQSTKTKIKFMIWRHFKKSTEIWFYKNFRNINPIYTVPWLGAKIDHCMLECKLIFFTRVLYTWILTTDSSWNSLFFFRLGIWHNYHKQEWITALTCLMAISSIFSILILTIRANYFFSWHTYPQLNKNHKRGKKSTNKSGYFQ